MALQKQLFSNLAVSWWDNGPYSHCELLAEHLGGDEYLCYSSSVSDHGVRAKRIVLDHKHWDIIEIDADIGKVHEWFNKNNGKKYDFLGLVGFLIRIIPGEKTRFFCSEAVAAMLGYKDPWRFSPNALYCSLVRG